MKSEITIDWRSNYANIKIKTAEGKEFRITVDDTAKNITVNSPDGALFIRPNVTNDIRIYSNIEP